MELGLLRDIWDNRQPDDIRDLRAIAETSEFDDIQREIKFHTRLFSMCANSIASKFQEIIAAAFSNEFEKNTF